MSGIVLVGAGGHAKVVRDSILALDMTILAYVDARAAAWLTADRFETEAALHDAMPGCSVTVGFAGMEPAALRRRLAALDGLVQMGHASPALCHPSAQISPDARIDAGVQVMPGAVVNAFATLGRGAIVNTRAVVEHDAVIGCGAHVAPGAIVLGGAKVGDCSMIGAGAVVLPGADIPAGTLVPSMTRTK